MTEQNLLDKNYIVSRSRQLINCKFPEWECGTLNVFDTYLSKINPLNPDSSEVKFAKREYEKLVGVSEMRPDQLNRYVTKLRGKTVSIPLRKGEWENYCLFDIARMEKRTDGEWMITLRCHPELKELFFNLDEKGYQKYRLEIALNLSTKYSKLLYYNLRNHLFHKNWRISIDELRNRIGVLEGSYRANKEFNKYVLKKAVSEINKKTELIIEYKNIYCGKTITAVEFVIVEKKKVSKITKTESAIEKNTFVNPKTNEIEQDIETLFAEACYNAFSKEQVRELYFLAKTHFDESLQYNTLAQEIYGYLREKYLYVTAKKDVKNLYGYMREAVKSNF